MTPEYINAHEPIYNSLIHYFLPDLSDPYFRQDAAQEIEQDERMTYCRYMAAWLPNEPHYNEILKQIAGAAQCANDKEDAAEHPLFLYPCDLSWCGRTCCMQPTISRNIAPGIILHLVHIP